MQISRLNELLLKILYLEAVGIIISQVLELDQITSLLFSGTFILVLVIWFISLYLHMNLGDILLLFTLAVAFLSICLESTMTHTEITGGYLKKFACFACTMFFFQIVFKMKGNERFQLYYHRLNLIVAIVLVAVFFLKGKALYVMNGIAVRYLTFGFTNPNLTAMFLSCIGMTEYIEAFQKTKKNVRLLHFFFGIMMTYFVYETESRNCLLIMLMFIAMLIYTGLKQEVHFGKKTIFIIVLWPLIFAAIYLYAVDQSWFKEMFSFLVSEGKDIESRESIWKLALQELIRSPIFGAYGEISGGTGEFQLHNTHLDLLVSYGVVTFIMVFRFLYKNLYLFASRINEKTFTLYFNGFIAAYLMGMGEAALFSGGLAIYLFVCGFLILSKTEMQNDAQKRITEGKVLIE